MDSNLVSWIEGANRRFEIQTVQIRALEARVKALTEHLEVEFMDRPAIPAYVAVVSTKAQRYTGGPSD